MGSSCPKNRPIVTSNISSPVVELSPEPFMPIQPIEPVKETNTTSGFISTDAGPKTGHYKSPKKIESPIVIENSPVKPTIPEDKSWWDKYSKLVYYYGILLTFVFCFLYFKKGKHHY